MNFFGHAVIASWRETEPAFVLGTMLPDFAAMIRARPPRARHASVERGIAFHHRTDEAFHDAPTFRALVAHAFGALCRLGVARGPARAAAHVGVEIVLDGILSQDERGTRAYLDALALVPSLEARAVDWTSLDEARRFFELAEALRARGVSPEHSSPEILALRVERALVSRPRLRLGEGDAERVRSWASEARPQVLARSEVLLAELREALALIEGRC